MVNWMPSMQPIAESEQETQYSHGQQRCRLMADSVEEVREPNEAGLACKGCRPFLGRQWGREWHQFGQLPKVLGSCCEEELVTGTIWSS